MRNRPPDVKCLFAGSREAGTFSLLGVAVDSSGVVAVGKPVVFSSIYPTEASYPAIRWSGHADSTRTITPLAGGYSICRMRSVNSHEKNVDVLYGPQTQDLTLAPARGPDI
jgi:hypothetical protein